VPGHGAYALTFGRDGVETPTYFGVDDGGAAIVLSPSRKVVSAPSSVVAAEPRAASQFGGQGLLL
jgi:hypothetical protein